MYANIVFPEENEKEFIKIAEALGYKDIIFCYKNKIPELNLKSKIKIHTSIISSSKSMNKLRNKTNLLIIESSDQDRQVFEKKSADIIFNLEESERNDKPHYRVSGMNHILAELAKNNELIVGFSFSKILNSNFTERAKKLGRIKQNIKLCKKYKVQTCFASFTNDPLEMRAPKDLISLLITLGMDVPKAKSSLTSALKKLKENNKKRSKEYIAEGIELVK